MIRYGSLIEKIADLKNLELAFYKAIKGKRLKSGVACNGPSHFKLLVKVSILYMGVLRKSEKL